MQPKCGADLPRNRIGTLLITILFSTVSSAPLFAQSADTEKHHDIGFHFSYGMGPSTLHSGAISQCLAFGYRRDDFMFTLCFAGHESEFSVLSTPPVTIADLGVMIGKIHTTDFLFWGYSAGVAMNFIEHSSGSDWWNGQTGTRTTSYGAALIGQFQAGVTLYHYVGLCGTIYASVNTTHPLVAAMITLQLGYL